MTDQPEFEELEHIPWAALAAKRPDPRVRIGAIAVVAVMAVGTGLLAASLLLGGDETSTIAGGTMPPVSVAPANIDIAPTTLSPQETLPATSMYSEADLMLISIEDEERLAVMQAEWFVRDYFTVDGDDSIVERIASLVPSDSAPPDLVSSYVEWVETFAVDSPEPGEYRVDVAYRLLIGSEDGFVREPAAAVSVALSIDVDGSAQLLQLPEPVAMPSIGGIDNASG